VSGRATIFTIVLENKNDEAIYGSANAPYLNQLIAMGGLAKNYKDTAHPSLPNYLHMISGANQYPGVVDVSPTQFPYFPADKPNLGTQLVAANIKWRSYQESMGTPCSTGANCSARGAPTRIEGELSRTRWGKRASSSALRRLSAS
jgi:hypothetical protein